MRVPYQLGFLLTAAWWLSCCNSPSALEAAQSSTLKAPVSVAASAHPKAARTKAEAAQPDTFRVAGGQSFALEPIAATVYNKVVPTKYLTFPADSIAAVATEHRFLRTAVGLVWRSGDTLLFKTKRGSVARLHDGPTFQGAEDSYEGYRYLDNLSTIGQWLVDVGKWEGHYFLLIDQASGKRTNLIGYPIISPDHRRLACASFSETSYDFDGLQLWQKPPGQPPQLLWQRLNAWGAESPVWANNQTLLFRQLADTVRYVRVQLPQKTKPHRISVRL